MYDSVRASVNNVSVSAVEPGARAEAEALAAAAEAPSAASAAPQTPAAAPAVQAAAAWQGADREEGADQEAVGEDGRQPAAVPARAGSQSQDSRKAAGTHARLIQQ